MTEDEIYEAEARLRAALNSALASNEPTMVETANVNILGRSKWSFRPETLDALTEVIELGLREREVRDAIEAGKNSGRLIGAIDDERNYIERKR